MLETLGCDVLGDGTTPAGPERTGQLPHRHLAQLCEFAQRRLLELVVEPLVDRAQSPRRQSLALAGAERGTIALELDRDLGDDRFHQHIVGEAGVAQLGGNPLEQPLHRRGFDVEPGFKAMIGPGQVAVEPLADRLRP